MTMTKQGDTKTNEVRGVMTSLLQLHAAALLYGIQQVEKLTRDFTTTMDTSAKEAKDLTLRLARAIEEGLDDSRRKTLGRVRDFYQRESDRISDTLRLDDIGIESLQKKFDEKVHTVAERLDEFSRKRDDEAADRPSDEAKTKRASRSTP